MRKSTARKIKADRQAYFAQRNQNAIINDVFLAAIHEAGHALAYTVLGVGVEFATVERKTVEHGGQQAFSSGFTQPLPRPLTKETIEQEAICIMAGPAAEDAFNGQQPSGSHGDIDTLRQCALHVGLSRDAATDLVRRAYRAACELVDRHMDVTKKIAFELMTKGRIEGAALEAIVKDSAK